LHGQRQADFIFEAGCRLHRTPQDHAAAFERPASGAQGRPVSTPPIRLSRATLPITLLIQAAASAAAVAPAVAAPRLIDALGVGPAAVGLYIATVYFGAAMSSQWCAALVKRWGPIRSSQAGLVLCAVGLVLVSVPHAAVAAVGALLLGAGYGPITPASSDMLIRTTPPDKVSLVFSIKQTGVPMGGIIAGLTVPVVLVAAGLGWALWHIACVCLAGVALAEVLRTRLDAYRDPHAPLPTLASMAGPMRFVWAHPLLRRLSLCTLVFSTVQVSVTSYLVSFLNVDLRWTLVAAGAALSVSQGAGVAGRILWGLVADRWNAPRLTLLGLAVVMALAGLAMPWLHAASPHGWVIVLLAIYGGTAVGWNGVYLATVARVVPHEQAAMATAGSLFFTYVGIVVGAPLFGALSTVLGSLGLGFALLAVPLAWAAWALARSRWSMG
jgi:MFS family permease